MEEKNKVSRQLECRPAGECKWDVAALGEVMLRLDPGDGRTATTRSFSVWEGGGEYNVIRGLQRVFGQRTTICTALVDNQVGRLVEDLINQGGVDTSQILWRSFDSIGQSVRNGLYFAERGFGLRPGSACYDRGHTAVAQLKPGDIDWDRLFGDEGVRWFHTGGVYAALSPEAALVTEEAMRAAHRHGVMVSFDLNYRASLWRDKGGVEGARALIRKLAPLMDVVIGNEGHFAFLSDEPSEYRSYPAPDAERFVAVLDKARSEFPQLKLLAATFRHVHHASLHDWSAFAYYDGDYAGSRHYNDVAILDRIGGGDGFVAGLIYGIMNRKPLAWALDCGVAHGALCMTTPGDNSMATLADVERLMECGAATMIR
ncbi:2-dehydro-3-deoxygluconate kinase [Acidisarcina polymorpha]|uniref:2-dehydro-3-deoxygluconate kinase n=1 Tax=Acidisarcina polymorpha TaxID=2211140 RepID=A0A2Z5G7K9_9BACT|nr:sugar kinase [Acidisarcina polymorpha]AXC14655.1 2-dehydro-3-deoxygluconate kinase [Acidisarcina polymorpha]